MAAIKAAVTDGVFDAFVKCRYKAYLKRQGEAGPASDDDRARSRSAAEYRRRAIESIRRAHGPEATVRDPLSVAAAVRDGATLILDAEVGDGTVSCRLDAVVPRRGRTAGRACLPVLFSPPEKVAAADRLRLAFRAAALASALGTAPKRGQIVHGPALTTTGVDLVRLAGPVRTAVGEIRALSGSAEPPPRTLNSHCPECEFRAACRAAAVERDDLSLLRGLSAKEIESLNRRGLDTVTQYAATFRPGRLRRQTGAKGGRHDHSLQALAVRDRKVYVARRPELPAARVSAYIDVEGVPDRDFYYLIGLAWDDGSGVRRASFWADRRADEGKVWAKFLKVVGGFGDDFVLFHYGRYETQCLSRLAHRHGGDPDLIAAAQARCVNVLSAIHARVYFPIYDNGLKSVAGCLGFRWSDPDASGLRSIAWRAEWEETEDAAAKQRLLTYNLEDCAALARVVAVLRDLAADSAADSAAADADRPEAADVEDIKSPRGHRFCDPAFVLPDFARVSKCAYFDYQRDKVLLRTNPAVRKAARRQARRRHRTCPIDRIVMYDGGDRCPRCGSEDFVVCGNNSRTLVDVKPVCGGLRRWVTKHRGRRFVCRSCDGRWLSEEYVAKFAPRSGRPQRYGWNLCGWVAYATVVLRQTSAGIVDALDDLFGVRVKSGVVGHIRHAAAVRYRPTFDSLLTELRAGPLVHADETWVRPKGFPRKSYVWTFAGPEVALYVYAPSREGDVLRETLAGFRGVLVSDFYAAYDSVECPQQKCVVHLIRDMNDDVADHPFDGELKELAARFGGLMRSIVETIDRHGLKRRHLARHKRDVERFFAAEEATGYGSERAWHYRRRLLKNREKLFTFLDHDGVPWNNNNAENAVKRFVSRRKGMDGTGAYSEAGLRDYLLLLSVYQTLRYRGLDFWRFVLSGETDVTRFANRSR
jgi:predicted RecB family nuclease